MDGEPTISVIIPAYNAAGCLARCLDAVRASRHQPLECIVVNDSSTDDTERIAAKYPVRAVNLAGGPKGPGQARNRGADLARGEILLFVDSDVIIRPDTLSLVAGTFARRPEIDALFGSYDENPGDPGFLSQYKNLFHHYVHQHGCEDATTFWGGCGAVRRGPFLALGGFDTRRYPRASIEDIEFGVRLHAGGHRILLLRQIQVQHLKRWTLRGLLKTDVFDRGIPWTRLILSRRNLPNDLNLGAAQRVSALLALALVGCLVVPRLWLLSPIPAVLIPVLNLDFYRFFLARRGAWFALGVFPVHVLYYLYSLASFGIGMVLHLFARRETRG
jgi:glycosyltransferase involved in cell wall biosynthesis